MATQLHPRHIFESRVLRFLTSHILNTAAPKVPNPQVFCDKRAEIGSRLLSLQGFLPAAGVGGLVSS